MVSEKGSAAVRIGENIITAFADYKVLQNTMKFVKFKVNGGDINVRVVEGWALSDNRWLLSKKVA